MDPPKGKQDKVLSSSLLRLKRVRKGTDRLQKFSEDSLHAHAITDDVKNKHSISSTNSHRVSKPGYLPLHQWYC